MKGGVAPKVDRQGGHSWVWSAWDGQQWPGTLWDPELNKTRREDNCTPQADEQFSSESSCLWLAPSVFSFLPSDGAPADAAGPQR